MTLSSFCLSQETINHVYLYLHRYVTLIFEPLALRVFMKNSSEIGTTNLNLYFCMYKDICFIGFILFHLVNFELTILTRGNGSRKNTVFEVSSMTFNLA
jgi:hypothetical protein